MLDKIKRTLGFIVSHKLARKNKFRAIAEFLIWQLQTLISPEKYYKKGFASTLKVLVNKGQTGMTGNLYVGLHEFEDMGFLLHFLRPGDLFIDAGANVGSYTLLASGLVGAKTIAFEPLPSTFKNLENNIKINQLSDLVLAHNKGLSSEKGVLRFSAFNDTTNHVLNNDEPESIEVAVCTLDEAVGSDCPSLIKIDVEGYETKVLKGSSNLLNNTALKAIIIELNGSGARYGFSDILIHNNLIDLGFKPSEYNPLSRTFHFTENYGHTNTIYIRDYSFVSDRIKTSKCYKIFDIEF